MSAAADTRAFDSLEDMLNAEDFGADPDTDATDDNLTDLGDGEDEDDAADTDEGDESDDDEADEGSDDDTDDADEGDDEPRSPRQQARLKELEAKAKQFDAREFPAQGRLRQATEELANLRPQVTHYQVAAQVQESLANTLLHKLAESHNTQVKLYEDAAAREEAEARDEPDPARKEALLLRKQTFLLQAANLRTQFENERNGVWHQAQQQQQQLLAQTQQQHETVAFDRNFRQETPDQLKGAIRALQQRHHLTEQDAARLQKRIADPRYQRILREAPLNIVAQTTVELAKEIAQEAKQLGQRRAKQNARQADQSGTFRREKAPQARPRRGGFDESKYRDKGEGGLAALLNYEDEQADRRARRR